MMREGDGRRAVQALNVFYSAGYNIIGAQHADDLRVDGLFVSDCGVLFTRGENNSIEQRLENLLQIIEEIHRRCSDHAVFLTTSIAWGPFSYHERIEFNGIEKNPIYGNAYINAFADNDGGAPKIYLNDCRIVRKGLPSQAALHCEQGQGAFSSRIRTTPKHFYFEWTRPR